MKTSLLLLIFLPLFANASGPCDGLKKNFLGRYSFIQTQTHNGSGEKGMFEISKWSTGLVFTPYENGRPGPQSPIKFGEGLANGKPTCLLSLGQTVFKATLIDPINGHYVFTTNADGAPFSLDVRKAN